MRDCNFHANIMEFVISFVFKNKNIIGMEQIMQPCKYVSELWHEFAISQQIYVAAKFIRRFIIKECQSVTHPTYLLQ